MDETDLSTCNYHSQVLSLIGYNNIQGGHNGVSEEIYTVMLAFSKGHKMPQPWYFVDSTTDRCYKQFEVECNYVDEDIITHIENG